MTATSRSSLPRGNTRRRNRMASRTEEQQLGGTGTFDSNSHPPMMISGKSGRDVGLLSDTKTKLELGESKTREESCETMSQNESSGCEPREICGIASHASKRTKMVRFAHHTPSITDATHSRSTTMDTQGQFFRDLCEWIPRLVPGPRGDRMAECFTCQANDPPITKKSLAELDINQIIANPKLRHDVNFDRELHFRPNLDGTKGRQKVKNAEEYWLALEAELELYTFLLNGATSQHWNEGHRTLLVKLSQKRIPEMFGAIREILLNLLPERDHPTVYEHLDVEMLMQEIGRGLCDLTSIARWLAQLLKAHCAPMRDEWVDRMVEKIGQGTANGSAPYMVAGLKELFGILEAMKLDVANHQIRHLRTILIEDTINFETKYHLERIERRKIDIEKARDWYFDSDPIEQSSPRSSETSEIAFFISGFLRLLLTGSQDTVPDPFYLDLDRIRSLRADLSDMVHMEICNGVFDELLRRLGVSESPSHGARWALQIDLSAILGEPLEDRRCWAANVENLALELVRHALRQAGSTKTYDAELVHITEDYLRRSLQQQWSSVLNNTADRLESLLYPRVMDAVEAQMNASPVDVFNALVTPMPPPPPPPPPTSSPFAKGLLAQQKLPAPPPQARSDPLADITRRIAHIAVLHWRIWAPIVYLSGETYRCDSPLQENDRAATRSKSDTTPIQRKHAPYEGCSGASQATSNELEGTISAGPTHLAFRHRHSAP